MNPGTLLPDDYFEPDIKGTPEELDAFVKAVHREPTEAQLKGWGIARGIAHGTVPSIHSRDLAGLADAQGPADHRRGGPDRGDHARRGPVGAADRYPAPQRRPRRIWRALLWLANPNVLLFAAASVGLWFALNWAAK